MKTIILFYIYFSMLLCLFEWLDFKYKFNIYCESHFNIFLTICLAPFILLPKLIAFILYKCLNH